MRNVSFAVEMRVREEEARRLAKLSAAELLAEIEAARAVSGR